MLRRRGINFCLFLTRSSLRVTTWADAFLSFSSCNLLHLVTDSFPV